MQIDAFPAKRLYLAYGSNLSRRQLAERCPDSQLVAAVRIRGWRLAFAGEGTQRWGLGGVATLVPEAGAETPGALYALSPAAEAAMDGFEGVAAGHYIKIKDFATSLTGVELPPDAIVFAYIRSEDQPRVAPAARYIETIRQGYRDWGFSEDPLALAVLD